PLAGALHAVGHDLVAFFEVVEARDGDAALEAGRHLALVVVEALERVDLALVQLLAAAQHAGDRATTHRARADERTGDRVATADAEDLPHLGASLLALLVDRLEQTLHGTLDVVHDLVDDV